MFQSTYDALGVDVRDIGSDTRRTLDIEERELSNSRVELEEEGERLANPAAGAEDSDLGKLGDSSSVQCAFNHHSMSDRWELSHVAGRGGEGSPLCGAEDGLRDLTSGEHDGECAGWGYLKSEWVWVLAMGDGTAMPKAKVVFGCSEMGLREVPLGPPLDPGTGELGANDQGTMDDGCSASDTSLLLARAQLLHIQVYEIGLAR